MNSTEMLFKEIYFYLNLLQFYLKNKREKFYLIKRKMLVYFKKGKYLKFSLYNTWKWYKL